MTPLEATLMNKIIPQFTMWYKWQLTFGEKRKMLRYFDQFIQEAFAKFKMKGLKPKLNELSVLPEGYCNFSRTLVTNRLAMLFLFMDNSMKDERTVAEHDSLHEKEARARTFITNFDTVFRDDLESKERVRLNRNYVKHMELCKQKEDPFQDALEVGEEEFA